MIIKLLQELLLPHRLLNKEISSVSHISIEENRWLGLYLDIFLLICSYLNYRDLLSLRLTNSNWRDMIRETKHLGSRNIEINSRILSLLPNVTAIGGYWDRYTERMGSMKKINIIARSSDIKLHSPSNDSVVIIASRSGNSYNIILHKGIAVIRNRRYLDLIPDGITVYIINHGDIEVHNWIDGILVHKKSFIKNTCRKLPNVEELHITLVSSELLFHGMIPQNVKILGLYCYQSSSRVPAVKIPLWNDLSSISSLSNGVVDEMEFHLKVHKNSFDYESANLLLISSYGANLRSKVSTLSRYLPDVIIHSNIGQNLGTNVLYQRDRITLSSH